MTALSIEEVSLYSIIFSAELDSKLSKPSSALINVTKAKRINTFIELLI